LFNGEIVLNLFKTDQFDLNEITIVN
jgi:hypothetical protein